ncbi:adenylyltransferase/cytidyltransferase family protein [Methanococcoides methylutens]|uniref:FAD synthase n=1 Tax=Methanococcoides methylutens MM1 TaxID=1434104 RepID=A0A0E3SQK1_METMT|nr:adenylyltransferase/cytidyltransferase family protein [Methanococcoides methylutens]AKB84961.1 FMN adenylyltransferase, type 3 archaeal [Methanococcoides methylutens MM1]
MIRVLATGTFDLLHPGHIFFLTSARAMGDELYVLVARDSMIRHKAKPIVPEIQRLEMISSLKAVDKAMLGSEKDIFEPLYEIDPDIIVLGHDQFFDVEELENSLRERGFKAIVTRIDESLKCPLYSSGKIINKILERYCENND